MCARLLWFWRSGCMWLRRGVDSGRHRMHAWWVFQCAGGNGAIQALAAIRSAHKTLFLLSWAFVGLAARSYPFFLPSPYPLPSYTDCFYSDISDTRVTSSDESVSESRGSSVALACAPGFSGSGAQAECGNDGAWTVGPISCTPGESLTCPANGRDVH